MSEVINIKELNERIERESVFVDTLRTEKGKVIFAETKGEHLKNDDSREKIDLGTMWSGHAGNQYRYFMVFEKDADLPKGAVSMSKFVEIVAAL